MKKTGHGTEKASLFVVYNFHDSGIFTRKKWDIAFWATFIIDKFLHLEVRWLE